MSELHELSLSEACDGIRAKKFSARELVESSIKAMEANRSLNAFVTETPEIALAQAKASDAKKEKGIIEGIPIAVKDLYCTKGVLTTACSHILDGFKPTYESTVTANLFKAGGIMLGKTSMDEFAMGSTNTSSYYGPVKNPWSKDEDLVPGGSSGGSAAAVAARITQGALGSDTGGSIRQPASFCGITGIKPTYGRCSRWGMVAFASSLDQAGPMARTVRDCAILLEAIAGFDEKDSTSANIPVPKYEESLTGNIKGLKVGVPKEYNVSGMDAEIKEMWEKGALLLKQAGAEIVDVSLPHTEHALPVYYIIAPAEASSNLARYDGVRYGLRVVEKGDSLSDMYMRTRGEGFGSEVKRRILMGTYVLSAGYYDAYYKKAQRVRTLIARDFEEVFKKVDVLLTPTTPSAAFSINNQPKDPVTMYLNDVFTVPASLAGVPAISIPGALGKTGLPLGLQIIGKAFDESTIIRAAGVLEESVGFKFL